MLSAFLVDQLTENYANFDETFMQSLHLLRKDPNKHNLKSPSLLACIIKPSPALNVLHLKIWVAEYFELIILIVTMYFNREINRAAGQFRKGYITFIATTN